MGEGIVSTGSGTYAFNGMGLLLMPSDAGWKTRELIGISGNGRPTYPTVREFEMRWDFMTMEEFAQIQGIYNAIQSTGTYVVDLPMYATNPYQFRSYSGCTVKEPEVGDLYETYVKDVKLLILRAR